MGYIDLFNSSVFPSYVYFAFFVGIACLTLLFIFTLLILNSFQHKCIHCLYCCFSLCSSGKKKSRNKNTNENKMQSGSSIQLTLKSFILRSQMPGTAAFMLHTVPFLLCFAIVGSLFHVNLLNLFWNFPTSLADVGKCFPPFSPVSIKSKSRMKEACAITLNVDYC
jgi:hypothetical protein